MVLAAVILAGAGFFVLLGAGLPFLLWTDRARMSNPLGASVAILLIFTIGIGFAYIGVRLLRVGKQAEHLLSPNASRIVSYCIAAIGVAVCLRDCLPCSRIFASPACSWC